MSYYMLKKFLMWCVIINGGLLTISSLFLVFASNFVYKQHSRFFPIKREAFDIIIYSFIGFYKIIYITFNLIPFIALIIIG